MDEKTLETMKEDIEGLKNLHIRPMLSVWSDFRLWGVCFFAIAVAELVELLQ